jgi:DNA-binding FrmR family transcriptional regulator
VEFDVSEEELAAIVNRLRRAQGQLAGIIRLIEEDRSCEEILTQLAAVSKALDRAGFAIIATGLQHCLTDNRDETDRTKLRGRLEKLFLSLA